MKRMKLSAIRTGIVLGIFLLSSACTRQDEEATMIAQEEQIDQFISRQTDKQVFRRNGSNRIVLEPGEASADSLEFGDSLRFFYAGYIFSNGPGSLFATNHAETAAGNGFSLTDASYEPVSVRFRSGELIPGLENGLFGVRSGEHAYIVFSAKYGFGKETVYNIPKLSPLIYEVWIQQVKKSR